MIITSGVRRIAQTGTATSPKFKEKYSDYFYAKNYFCFMHLLKFLSLKWNLLFKLTMRKTIHSTPVKVMHASCNTCNGVFLSLCYNSLLTLRKIELIMPSEQIIYVGCNNSKNDFAKLSKKVRARYWYLNSRTSP